MVLYVEYGGAGRRDPRGGQARRRDREAFMIPGPRSGRVSASVLVPSSFIALLRNEAVINPVKLVVTFSSRRLEYVVTRCWYVTFSPLTIEIPYITHINTVTHARFIFLIA